MILAPTAQKLQQSHLQDAREKGRGNTPPRQAPQKVTLTEKGTVDAPVHPPPPPPPPLLPRLPLACPVLPVATTHTKERTSTTTTTHTKESTSTTTTTHTKESTSTTTTHTKESTSAATIEPGDSLQKTTTQDPLHVPLLYLGACKIASR